MLKETKVKLGNETHIREGYPSPVLSDAWMIYHGDISNLEGRLLTIIEAAGMPSKQEDSIKQMISKALWATREKLVPIANYGELWNCYNDIDEVNSSLEE